MVKSFTLILMVCVYLFLANFTVYAAVLPDTTSVDTETTQTQEVQKKADYENVDVIVETEWSDPEKNLNVSVFLDLKSDKPNIVLMKDKHKECEIRLFKGVVVKIRDHKTGKLIRTIQL